jgi:arylsulfatase A
MRRKESNFLRLTAASIVVLIVMVAISLPRPCHASESVRPPNFILILCDNLGYGDIGCFGSKTHRTPHIDRLASEGVKFTDFYVASGVCTPSRASLMTGCYPRRVNMHQSENGGLVLRPVAHRGLHPDETTIAEVLKKRGYATALIGKWHLGDQKEFLPTRQGFDYYFGIPYSDDMTPREGQPWPPLPLLKNETVIEAPVDRATLTKRYTQDVIQFISNNREQPMFIVLSHAMPGSTRAPFASESFRGRSSNGPWGDSVEEIDWSTGEILSAVKENGLDAKTLIVWTSDNGAPRRMPPQGLNRPLGGWGYTTMEGGMRVPCLVRWPDNISAGSSCSEIATAMDLLPTFARLAKAKLEREIDGRDIWPLMSQSDAKSPHDAFYYYFKDTLHAVRSGTWKLHLALPDEAPTFRGDVDRSKPRLFNLVKDLGEASDVASNHADIVARLNELAERGRADLGDFGRAGRKQRPAGHADRPVALHLPKGR